MSTTTKKGTVTTFSPQTGRGKISLAGGKEIMAFGATSFRSGRPARYPAKGDPVQVVVSEASGAAVTVRLLPAKAKPTKKPAAKKATATK